METKGIFGGGGKSSPGNSPATTKGHSPWVTTGGELATNTRIGLSGQRGILGAIIAGVTIAAQAAVIGEQINTAIDYFDSNLEDYKFIMRNYNGLEVNDNGSVVGTYGPQPGPMFAFRDRAFIPFYIADYYPMTGAAVARVKAYDEKWLQSRRRVHRYALGAQRHTDYNFYMIRRKAAFTAWLSGRRIEDARKDLKDDQIQTHKVQAMNFGITAGNIARQGLASATGNLEKAYDELGTRVGNSGASRREGFTAGTDFANKLLGNAKSSSSSSGANIAPHTIGTGPD